MSSDTAAVSASQNNAASAATPADDGKLFVGGLNWLTTTEGLRAYFEKFGPVTECSIMKDPAGKSRCFGFVTFADSAVADSILDKTHILDKKQIDPKRAVPKEQQQSGRRGTREESKIFVGGIHIDATEEDVSKCFQQFDEVVETVLMRDRESGRSRGFAFVTFASPTGVSRSCSSGEIRILDRQVEVKTALPRGRMGPPGGRMQHGGGMMDPYAGYYGGGYGGGGGAGSYGGSSAAYYDAMMKAYGGSYSPAALAAAAAYYSQLYGGFGGGETEPPRSESVDMRSGSGSHQEGHDMPRRHGDGPDQYYPHDYHHHHPMPPGPFPSARPDFYSHGYGRPQGHVSSYHPSSMARGQRAFHPYPKRR